MGKKSIMYFHEVIKQIPGLFVARLKFSLAAIDLMYGLCNSWKPYSIMSRTFMMYDEIGHSARHHSALTRPSPKWNAVLGRSNSGGLWRKCTSRMAVLFYAYIPPWNISFTVSHRCHTWLLIRRIFFFFLFPRSPHTSLYFPEVCYP